MKKIVLYCLILCLSVLAVWQYARYKYQTEVVELIRQEYAKASDESHDYEGFIERIRTNDFNIGDTYIYKYNGDSIRMNELNGTKSLWIRYCLGSCKSCIDSINASLMRLSERDPEIQINMLISNISSRTMYIFQKEHKDKLNFYNIQHLPIDFDELGFTPIAFKLDNRGKLKDAVIYSRSNPEMFESYIRNVVSGNN